jgi:hypothetical protein
MGTICGLTINGYDIFETKNDYQRDIINLIFDESDFQIAQEKDEDGSDFISKKFISKVGICKKKLEIYGTNYSKSKTDFEIAIEKYKSEYEITFNNEKDVSYENYKRLIEAIIITGIKDYENCDNPYSSDFDKFIRSNDFIVPNQQLECLLWTIFDSLDDEIEIVYDLTFIIESGWITQTPEKELDIQKIIVLTEGRTDSEFIKKGIDLFYPYLSMRYHFMDFDNSNYESNASRLVQTIKAFVGSGIKNKIIALFDSDTAAIKEINNLNKTRLPDNIKVFKYPLNELALNYPTQGPNGLFLMDVNESGCSIEMYLGKKALSSEEGLLPVQWKGYDSKLQRYQGEVRDKTLIQKKFRELYKKRFYTKENIDIELPELKAIIDLLIDAWSVNNVNKLGS